MRRSKFKLPKSNGVFALNINSMTDMFTIMLVFLLQTYTTETFQMKTPANLKLPQSNVEKSAKEALQISISPTELKFKEELITQLSNTEFKPEILDQNDADLIKPFLEKLQGLSAEVKEKSKGEIIVQADRNLPYRTLKKVFYTASVAGYPKLKLATAAGN